MFKSIKKNTGFQILDEYTSLYAVMHIDHSSNCWEKLKLICHNGDNLIGKGYQT